MIRKVGSFFKIIALAVWHVLLTPFLLVKPKYDNYVFVLTTGRSGSGSLSEIFRASQDVNSFHEPYPIINNRFNFSPWFLKFWYPFVFYFVKYPKILLSKTQSADTYLETNHLFIKTFAYQTVKAFNGKVKLIHLEREPHKVAKSMYEINKIPGERWGNKWYLDPYEKSNLIDFTSLIEGLDCEVDDKDFLKCLWYCYEIKARAKEFINDYPHIDIIKLKTKDLNDRKPLLRKFKDDLNIGLSNTKRVQIPDEEQRNKKTSQKVKSLDIEKTKELHKIFLKILNRMYGRG